MENASKALLISASVLIAIILIAVGIRILGTVKPTVDQVGKVSTSLEVSIFNSQFTKYEGMQKGSQVKALLRLIRQNNINNSNKIGVAEESNGSGAYINDEELDDFINGIDVTKGYSVNLSTDTMRLCVSSYNCFSLGGLYGE